MCFYINWCKNVVQSESKSHQLALRELKSCIKNLGDKYHSWRLNAMVSNAMMSWHKAKEIEQYDRMKCPKVYPHF